MKLNNTIIDNIVKKLSRKVPDSIKMVTNEFEEYSKNILKTGFEKLDLVTHEEFNIQKEVLTKTRIKLEKLEKAFNEFIDTSNEK